VESRLLNEMYDDYYPLDKPDSIRYLHIKDLMTSKKVKIWIREK